MYLFSYVVKSYDFMLYFMFALITFVLLLHDLSQLDICAAQWTDYK